MDVNGRGAIINFYRWYSNKLALVRVRTVVVAGEGGRGWPLGRPQATGVVNEVAIIRARARGAKHATRWWWWWFTGTISSNIKHNTSLHIQSNNIYVYLDRLTAYTIESSICCWSVLFYLFGGRMSMFSYSTHVGHWISSQGYELMRWGHFVNVTNDTRYANQRCK